MSHIDPDHLACKELVEVVTDYMEGALDTRDRTRFEEHLLVCQGCTAYFAQMRRMVDIAGTLDQRASPPAAKDALLAAFRRRKGGNG